jgi:acetoin utilization deacetylase AcuC-like enzyme
MTKKRSPALVYSRDFKLHDPSPYSHPESPERLDKMLQGLKIGNLLDSFDILEPSLGDINLFLKVHTREYFDYVLSRGKKSVEWLDGDTYISPGTHVALKRLAGAAELIAEEIESRDIVVLLPRPPGHHAGRNGRGLGAPTLGFCIFNISALIAELIKERGYKVGILDFDAHHGNGTQDIFYSDSKVLHVDIHQDSSTIYPGTGFPKDCGLKEAYGTKVNINIPPLSGDDIFVDASNRAIKFISDFDPDILVVDAGFDGYRGDNYMVSLKVGSRAFNYLGKLLGEIKKKVVVVVEGGYDTGLTRALPSFISGLLKEPDPIGDPEIKSDKEIWRFYERRLKELEEALRR